MVEEGTFRADLYHRLNVLELTIPALRDRPEDIKPLIQHFTEVFQKENNRKVKFLNSAVEVLKNNRWTGNIRELKNVVDRHLALSESDSIKKEDLDSSLTEAIKVEVENTFTWKEHLEIQKIQSAKFIEDVISKTPNKSAAAKLLGITRQGLYKLIDGFRGEG